MMNDFLITGEPGLDVSHYRPIYSFDALVKTTPGMVGVKATEGKSFVDSKLNYHQNGLRARAFKDTLVIYYHFARSGDPKQQADFFMDHMNDGGLQENERVALDLEVLPADPDHVLAWVEAWYTAIEERRRAAVLPGMDNVIKTDFIYTSRRIWDQFGNPKWNRVAKRRPKLWAPRYSTTNMPALPAPWTTLSIWQWSDGEVPDIVKPWPGVGTCDQNVWTGPRDSLRAWLDSERALPLKTPLQVLVAKMDSFTEATDDELAAAKIFIEQIQAAKAGREKI